MDKQATTQLNNSSITITIKIIYWNKIKPVYNFRPKTSNIEKENWIHLRASPCTNSDCPSRIQTCMWSRHWSSYSAWTLPIAVTCLYFRSVTIKQTHAFMIMMNVKHAMTCWRHSSDFAPCGWATEAWCFLRPSFYAITAEIYFYICVRELKRLEHAGLISRLIWHISLIY